ncbi:hypothetical protein PDJAM_G00160940, partial [Pangasius djambal]|nr:hypothetical protein [Pangasius djambal]
VCISSPLLRSFVPCVPRLTGVCPPVGFEVGALGVNLTAALKLAAVDAPPLGVRRLGPPRPSHALDAERQHGAATTMFLKKMTTLLL